MIMKTIYVQQGAMRLCVGVTERLAEEFGRRLAGEPQWRGRELDLLTEIKRNSDRGNS